MKEKILFSGNFGNDDLIKIFFRIYTEKLSGSLIITDDKGVITSIIFKESTIIFANSDSEKLSLGSYLIRNKIIDEIQFKNASEFSLKNNKRMGRALLELNMIDYDTLWKGVKEQLTEVILSLFINDSGSYEFISDLLFENENITLDIEIPNILIRGSRKRQNKLLINEKLASTEEIYPLNYSKIKKFDLKPYELHILKLIENESSLKKILERSELLKFDTLKLIDLFLTMGVITNNRNQRTNSNLKSLNKPRKIIKDSEKISGSNAFKSFTEALKYYNAKYELIYKVFSKEIGPIALSILQKSIKDISENLPTYLQSIKWNPNGTIQEESLLKKLYHKDFQENIKEFLTGLEEILYAGIFAIRKNISPDKEKIVLKWINKPAK